MLSVWMAEVRPDWTALSRALVGLGLRVQERVQVVPTL